VILAAINSSHPTYLRMHIDDLLCIMLQDQAQMLVNVTSQLPNNELLLQKHFMAVLFSVWRSKCRRDMCRMNTYSSALRMFSARKTGASESWSMTNFRPSFNLVSKALADVQVQRRQMLIPPMTRNQEQRRNYLELELNFLVDQHICDEDFRSINVSILEPEPFKQPFETVDESLLSELSCRQAENRLRSVLILFFMLCCYGLIFVIFSQPQLYELRIHSSMQDGIGSLF
jgi:hypothetical protein